MMFQLDQVYLQEIDRIIKSAGLCSEMERMIKHSLNADCPTGELFKWAYLTAMSCECAGGKAEDALPGAIAMEFFALAADIFDDIQDQDNDDMPWRRIPEANAINLATCLLMLSFKAISEIEDTQIYGKVSFALHNSGITASDGQFQEFLYIGESQISLEQYFKMVDLKAGSLVACACQIGALLAGAPEGIVLSLTEFGRYFGIMSQIRNDLFDFHNFSTKKDFVMKKKTLPFVYLLHVLKDKEDSSFHKLTILESGEFREFGEREIDQLQRISDEEGVTQFCTVMYELYRGEAVEALEQIVVPEKQKRKMKELVENIS